MLTSEETYKTLSHQEKLEFLYRYIFDQFHKTRLTHDLHIRLTPGETEFLLEELRQRKC